MNHGSLFSGIGGFDLAAEWMGWDNAFHCEWEDFPRKVLSYHFPNAKSYGDIKETDFNVWRGQIDIFSGGFPCQPFSTAGKRKGTEDDRYLWGEMLRAIQEISPRWIVGENVRGLVNWNGGMVFDTVCTDLEAEGYKVFPILLPAAAVNAPHRRDRIWFVAFNPVNCGYKARRKEVQEKNGISSQYRTEMGSRELDGASVPSITPYSSDKRLQGSKNITGIREIGEEREEQFARFLQQTWEEFPTQSPVCGGNDGIPRELDSITFPKWRNESIKACDVLAPL